MAKDSSYPVLPASHSAAKKLFRAIFDYSPANEDELTLKVGDIVEFLGHEEEGWYSGQLKGQTGVFPFNYVEELPSPATISSAPTTDDKQLSSVTLSEIRSDTPLIPIAKEGGAATLHRDDPTPPTSAGETECLLQCMRVYFILSFADVPSVGGGEQTHFHEVVQVGLVHKTSNASYPG